ncbi:putative oxidoreductase [Mycobacteroides stephanolepidis]|uniref:Putative oxidoreductase n=1 Tax=[Mycobacterium] stephanolepidis TaxID=1520670 RepID=A0A1Z4EXY3_9MYCO|nr:acyl-CoA dehydrogenase family protein [[Mycobacterium] stephanolepidis]BAX97801.1 putative oxidoreductase [[Mycobacterium] stephanolepidis]
MLETTGAAYEIAEKLLPGMLDALSEKTLQELEVPGSPGIEIFRKFNGPALVIPTTHSGAGASPIETVAVMRAIATKSPSLAVATAMHHFSVATLFTLADSLQSSGFEWAMLEVIASQRLLVSSAFAEGVPGQSVVSPVVSARHADGGVVINGSKKPCSLSRSMDFVSLSMAVPPSEGKEPDTLFALIPAQTDGVSVHPFWGTPVLGGAESDEVRFTEVFVDEQLTVPANNNGGALDLLQTIGFVWFELLITSCYLGAATALVERVYEGARSSTSVRADLSVRLETATLLLERVALHLQHEQVTERSLVSALHARYGAQDAIREVAAKAVEALGGIGFISTSDVAYLSATCQCAAFHPPSRLSMSDALAEAAVGGPLRLS